MAKPTLKLRTGSACRVVRLERDRYNEAAAANLIPCMPQTSPGRARLFDRYDLLALWYYRELIEDGYIREKAGHIACEISSCAREYKDAPVISYVEDYFNGNGSCFPAVMVPHHEDWDSTTFSGTDIRKVTNYRVSKALQLIDHYTSEELSVQGTED